MNYVLNRDFNRLAVHTAVGTLASALSLAFSAVFLVRVGLAPPQIFLTFATILTLRFILRPMVLWLAPALGLRCAFILGTILCSLSCLALALVDDIGFGLVTFVIVSALGQVFYCTCYHVFFSALGDAKLRGSQIGIFQALGALAALLGPGVGGVLLTVVGPWASFGTAFLIALAGIVPILHVTEPRVLRRMPKGAYAAAKNGAQLYFADGWIQMSLTTAWSIVMFQGLGGRYDSFGATLSLAGLAGALGGMLLGHLIDKGHARRAVWISTAILAVGIILRSVTFGHAAAVVAVAIGTTVLSGSYLPSWMTPVYNEAKVSPCMLRFQIVTEAGWDGGGAMAGGIAAAICFFGLPIEATILLALPMVVVQALLLEGSYAKQPGAGGEAPRAGAARPVTASDQRVDCVALASRSAGLSP